jgi:hypothetical protein
MHAVLMHPLVETTGGGISGLRVWGTTGTSCDLSSLICADDAEAIAKAKRPVADHDVELWSGKRFVIRLEVTTK